MSRALQRGDETCRKRNTSAMPAQRVVQRTMTTSVSRGRSVVRPEAGVWADRRGDGRDEGCNVAGCCSAKCESGSQWVVDVVGVVVLVVVGVCYGQVGRDGCRLERYRVASVPPEQCGVSSSGRRIRPQQAQC
jgi:hypothetical protein